VAASMEKIVEVVMLEAVALLGLSVIIFRCDVQNAHGIKRRLKPARKFVHIAPRCSAM